MTSPLEHGPSDPPAFWTEPPAAETPPPPAGPGDRSPAGHLGWAITALVFFWPLGIVAFVYYSRVESSFYRGDVEGARRASAEVRRLGIVALAIGVAGLALLMSFAYAI